MWEAPPLCKLQDAIRDPSNAIGMRMRAAYFLKQAYTNNNNNNNSDGKIVDQDQQQEQIIQCLIDGLKNTRHGSLMRHEYAYVMGQMGDERVSILVMHIITHTRV